MNLKKFSLLIISGFLLMGIFTLTGCIEEDRIPEIDEDLEFELELISEEGGTTNPAEGIYNYTAGETITVEAIPEEGYEFTGWEREGSAEQCEQYEETCEFVIVNNSMLSAHFEEIEEYEEYQLKINMIGRGETNPAEGVYTHKEGEEIKITATPAEGWTFKEWTGDYEGTEEEITITMENNKELKPVFSQAYEEDENITEEDKEDIKGALNYSEEQEICTMEYRELRSPRTEYVYGAIDGCQIEYLEQRNWTTVEIDEEDKEMSEEDKEDIEGAKNYSEEQEICKTEYKELKSPRTEYVFEATGCKIEYLEQRNWTAAEPEDNDYEDEEEIQKEIVRQSTEDVNCGWVSTNCCPAHAGANWECVNTQETTIECPENPICLQVYVGEPTGECISVDGRCTPEEEQEFSEEIE